jgi:hypothetical protein
MSKMLPITRIAYLSFIIAVFISAVSMSVLSMSLAVSFGVLAIVTFIKARKEAPNHANTAGLILISLFVLFLLFQMNSRLQEKRSIDVCFQEYPDEPSMCDQF